MTYSETENMTVEQLCAAIECHMAEAEMHMMTAQGLLDVVSRRELQIEPGAKLGGWVQ